jgi:hypothetical protein
LEVGMLGELVLGKRPFEVILTLLLNLYSTF